MYYIGEDNICDTSVVVKYTNEKYIGKYFDEYKSNDLVIKEMKKNLENKKKYLEEQIHNKSLIETPGILEYVFGLGTDKKNKLDFITININYANDAIKEYEEIINYFST